MISNVDSAEYGPRLGIALASAIASAFVPSAILKGLLLGAAGGMLITVATRYCPVNDLLGVEEATDSPHWRTIRTHRVDV
jgi:hypothetical protein